MGGFFLIEEELEESENVSMWVEQGGIITPSTDLKVKKTLEPGIYKVGVSREVGYYCEKIIPNSDELYVFKDSIVPDLLKEINNFWDKSELFKQNNLVHKRGILLQGAPGTSKSSTISILAQEISKRDGVMFLISDENNFLDYLSFLISFKKIQPDTQIITVIEQIDTYDKIEDELQDFLDGKTSPNHNITICTTNNSEDISDALLRPSRIDLILEMEYPSEQTRRDFFIYKGISEEDVDKFVEATEDKSFPDMKELYIGVYIFGYDFDEMVDKINDPREKKNYSVKNSTGKIEL